MFLRRGVSLPASKHKMVKRFLTLVQLFAVPIKDWTGCINIINIINSGLAITLTRSWYSSQFFDKLRNYLEESMPILAILLDAIDCYIAIE